MAAGDTAGSSTATTSTPSQPEAQHQQGAAASGGTSKPACVADNVYSSPAVRDVDLSRGGFVVLTARDKWGNIACTRGRVRGTTMPAAATCEACQRKCGEGLDASTPPTAASTAAGSEPHAAVVPTRKGARSRSEDEVASPPAPTAAPHTCGFVVEVTDVSGRPADISATPTAFDGSAVTVPRDAPPPFAPHHVVRFPWGSSLQGPRLHVTLHGTAVPGSPFLVPLPDSYVKRVGGGYNTNMGIEVVVDE